jgi:TnpA family transposase
VLEALQYIQQYRTSRRQYVPREITLDFASQRWQVLIKAKHQGRPVFDRRQLEVCVFSYLAVELRRGDIYIVGSEEFADYRQQLLSWEECQPRLAAYCKALALPVTATGFVQQLQELLTSVTQQVDAAFSESSAFSIDPEGKPHLKRATTRPLPEGFEEFEEAMKARLPERHLLEILKHVHYWVNYTRHFGPPSGSDAKMSDAISKYLVTVFGYGCNLGAAQTARHTRGIVTRRSMKRIGDQHISASNLEAALRDVINEYIRFRLPLLWGTGQSAIADGTHIGLRENNLLGEHHVRYGEYGAIAYHHVSDTYIALFSHFIACGVWEAVYILDGLLKNKSDIQPDTVHGDTQGQSEPIFGLAHLLGIQLMPRMRTWNKVAFYRPDAATSFEHIDSLFTRTVNWQLIQTHWQDLMQVVLSIQAGKVLPSMLLQKLGSHNRHNKLYQAFSEVGRVIRTIFLLKYLSKLELRQEIRSATTIIEAYHNFTDWISFGGDDVITHRDPIEQEKRIKYMDLVANAVMLQNVVDMTDGLHQMAQEGDAITKEKVARLSPYLTEHIKRFGEYVVDLDSRPVPLQPDKPFLTD